MQKIFWIINFITPLFKKKKKNKKLKIKNFLLHNQFLYTIISNLKKQKYNFN